MKIQGKKCVGDWRGPQDWERPRCGCWWRREHGWVIADINDQAGSQLAAELGAERGVLSARTFTQEKDIAAGHAGRRPAQHGGLHILVTTAGVGVAEKVLGKNGMHDLSKFARVIQINLIGTFDAVRQAANLMSGKSSGRRRRARRDRHDRFHRCL